MKQFTKITVLGLVFALALGSANCKKDEKDDTGTMLLLLSLLNTSSCGKLDYSLGYFMAQVAPPSALTGVGGYPWSYESCKPTYSINGSATKIGPITVVTGTVTTYTYTNGYLSTKEVKGSANIAAGTTGYDGSDGAIAATSTTQANCPSNRTGTNGKRVDVVGTTTYTRDANNNVTTEETKYTCGGNNVTYYGSAYAKKVMTYNADNRILTLKYYVNSDRTYDSAAAATSASLQNSYVNTAGANPIATLDYTYTPTSGIPSTVKVVGKSFYMAWDFTTASANTRTAATNQVDEVTWNFTTASAGVLSGATYTETCNAVKTTDVSTSKGLLNSFTSSTTATNCGPAYAALLGSGMVTGSTTYQAFGAWPSYGDSTSSTYAAASTQHPRTVTITLTQDTKNTSRLASYKTETVTKTYTNYTTSGTVSQTKTTTSTNTLSYDSNGRLNNRLTVSSSKYANTPAITCTTLLTPDAGTCDGTSNNTTSIQTYSYNGNGIGVFAGAETFSTASATDIANNPTLWDVK